MTYVVVELCVDCKYTDCAAVCPVDCCVPDEMYRETVDELMAKKEKLHI